MTLNVRAVEVPFDVVDDKVRIGLVMSLYLDQNEIIIKVVDLVAGVGDMIGSEIAHTPSMYLLHSSQHAL